MAIFTRFQVYAILEAYRTLFPKPLSPILLAYWDYSRTRHDALLTTDFHSRITNVKVTTFHHAFHTLPTPHTHASLRACVLAHNMGFSLGISPWTDDLLLRTFRHGTYDVIIILAHNWYPIIDNTGTCHAFSPLECDSIFHYPKYHSAINPIPDENRIILFINLYPDFLPSGSRLTGTPPGGAATYAMCVSGFIEICGHLIKSKYNLKVVSWGGDVYDALSIHHATINRSIPPWAPIFKTAINGLGSGILPKITIGSSSIDYFPFYHPSAPQFNEMWHLGLYHYICSTRL